ncbi:MAG: TldD/PmbA family protein [Nanoarchaeota archaeon]
MIEELRKFLKYGKEKADFVEISLDKIEKDELSVENNKLKSASYSDIKHVLVRTWIDGKLGVAVSNALDKNVIDNAINCAKNSVKKEFFYGLPNKQKYGKIKNIYDKEVEECGEKLSGILNVFLAQFDNRKAFVSEAQASAGVVHSFLVNSEGIEADEKSSFIDLDAGCVAKGNEDSSVSDSISSRKFFKLNDVESFGQSLCEETELFLKCEKLKKFEIPKIVVLQEHALNNILEDAFLENFNAENLIKESSILKGKENTEIASKDFNLIDDGLLEGGMGSGSFDSEGTACRRNGLVEKGILKNFIYDYNSAVHLKKQPTGNASADSIDFNNILISPGNKEIESEIDNAIIIKNVIGTHTANSFTTDFSVNSNLSYYLKNGNKIPLKNFMISGNFLNMLKNIELIGKKIIVKGDFYTPAIAFNSVNVTSY